MNKETKDYIDRQINLLEDRTEEMIDMKIKQVLEEMFGDMVAVREYLEEQVFN